ncbi:MAG: phosphohydrolase [Solobacterium sp.]|nr:phosphohydrolase [Solobacterium sp.]
MKIEEIMVKMIRQAGGNHDDISHFLKVHSFAHTIGLLEGLDARTQYTLEAAAIVHDIACPLCRVKYGNTDGRNQEIESEPLLREFFKDTDIDKDIIERVIFLVTHHHTYTGVDGIDWQILLESDFLVNGHESEKYRNRVQEFRKNIFKTKAGLLLLDKMFGNDM